jgi:hypothetical protein
MCLTCRESKQNGKGKKRGIVKTKGTADDNYAIQNNDGVAEFHSVNKP